MRKRKRLRVNRLAAEFAVGFVLTDRLAVPQRRFRGNPNPKR